VRSFFRLFFRKTKLSPPSQAPDPLVITSIVEVYLPGMNNWANSIATLRRVSKMAQKAISFNGAQLFGALLFGGGRVHSNLTLNHFLPGTVLIIKSILPKSTTL
jgi:hypothetical protein